MPRFAAVLLISLQLCAGPVLAQARPEPGRDASVDRSDPAPETPILSFDAEYIVDGIGIVSGGTRRDLVYLDNLSVNLGIDLNAWLGWKGASLHVQGLNNAGGTPNDIAGTLEGVDNIEVSRQRAKLFELYFDQQFAGDRGLIRVGFFDLNAEFYANDAAGLLIGPAYGIGSELASTGPNGPSIFPSTALGALVKGEFGSNEDGEPLIYAQAAFLDAQAGVPGDPGGFSYRFRDGALTIGEVGTRRFLGAQSKLALGIWAYTQKQDDVRDADALGNPMRRRARGVYLLFDRALSASEDQIRASTLFLRLGASEGQTTPFIAGGQAGVYVKRLFAGRPNSEFSFGARVARINARSRANIRDGGDEAAPAEYGFEATYSDQILPWLRLQPLLQYNANPGGFANAKGAFVAGIRLALHFSRG